MNSSNPCMDQVAHFVNYMKIFDVINFVYNHKKMCITFKI
jgi:hypothetical protein